MSKRHQTTDSHSEIPSKNENDAQNRLTENYTEPLQAETSVEPNTNPTESTQNNPLQVAEPSYSKILTGKVENPLVELRQKFVEIFPLEQTQVDSERLGLQHHRSVETGNHKSSDISDD